MLVYIDDREDEEFDSDYGYDYGEEEDSEYEPDTKEKIYDYVESSEKYLD